MKKVLLTINHNRLSGIERFTFLLSKYINYKEFDVIIGLPTAGPLCKLLQDNNIKYFIFDNKRIGKITLSGFLNLFKKIRKEKYDIIHAQAGIAPCVIGKILGVKKIFEHRHGLDFTSDYIDNMNRVRKFYESSKKYFVNYTITCCEKDKITLVEKFKFKKDKVLVVYYGIEILSHQFKKNQDNKFIIGTVGRLEYQKGHEYFIEMARKLIMSGYNFEFHIYGMGQKLNDLIQLVSRYDLTKTVLIKGYTNDVDETLATFDIFVMTSRYEGIPFAIFEAMRSGLPIITTEVGGINEVINNMKNGILVKSKDIEALVESVKLLYESENLRMNIALNAKNDFNKKYIIDKTIKKMEFIYKN